MKIHAPKFGAASAIIASLLWVICSVSVMLMPSMMLALSGDMLHMQLNDMGWHITLIGVVKGLLAWSFLSGVAGWGLAAIYNRLL
jgi:hypothetical protein